MARGAFDTGAPKAARGRKKRPRYVAVISDECTGCAGSPICSDHCPVDGCMVYEPDPDHPPFWKMRVDPALCIGCRKCATGGPEDINLTGCPWEAIYLLPTEEWEAANGPLPNAA